MSQPSKRKAPAAKAAGESKGAARASRAKAAGESNAAAEAPRVKAAGESNAAAQAPRVKAAGESNGAPRAKAASEPNGTAQAPRVKAASEPNGAAQASRAKAAGESIGAARAGRAKKAGESIGAARAPRAKALKMSAQQATLKVPPSLEALNGRKPSTARDVVAERKQQASRAPEPADVWDERVAGFLGFLRRRITGQYEVDDFGFDPDLTESIVYPPLRLLYKRYFRVETVGAHHLPPGGALIVANHSGTLPMDALMLSLAVHDETAARRHLRLLGADLVFRIPILSELARKGGTTLACNPDAERLLRAGEYVGVFPEGYKGLGKPYRDRYKLQRFGRGGFVSAALRTGLPIVPVSIVGAEEIYPIIGNLKPLARMANLPYFPVTPLFPLFGPLGAVPLPSKWLIEFGTPISTKSLAGEADDPIVVFNLADQVRETIQETLRHLLRRRSDPFA